MADGEKLSIPDLRKHILLRPDAYIGSVGAKEDEYEVFEGTSLSLVTFVTSRALLNMFDEAAVNAADNHTRGLKPGAKKMTYLEIVVNAEKGWISVANDGPCIACEKEPGTGQYRASIVFGHLLASTNHDDEQKRLTGGRNGYGIKLVNIFSKKFRVVANDQGRGKKFSQTWRNNMSVVGEPEVVAEKGKNRTCVTFHPDLERLGMEKICDNTVALFRRRALELAATLGNDVAVTFNGDRLLEPPEGVRPRPAALKLYAAIAFGEDNPSVGKVFGDRWTVHVAAASDDKFEHHSFVNHIRTADPNSTHVRYVKDQIVNGILALHKRKTLKRTDVMKTLHVVVSCMVVNPEFGSQSKGCLTTPAANFGSKCEIWGAAVKDEAFIRKVMKETKVSELIDLEEKTRQARELRRTDGFRRSTRPDVPKLEDAVKAGTAEGHKCWLILTEGDSAKARAPRRRGGPTSPRRDRKSVV